MLQRRDRPMARQSYCTPFIDFVGHPGDPHDCWQEDGFWPDRVDAELDHILVWGTEIGLSYFNNGGMVAYLQFISGRTLPEMELGFGILDCPESQSVCTKAKERFGDTFPRNDQLRSDFVAANELLFDECGNELWDAMEADNYELVAEEYYKAVCIAHSIAPCTYPE